MRDRLRRELGVPAAALMGLGSVVGTGVFVSIGVAADVAGPAVLLAIGAAALVAMCNGLSSAALAASHPVSGGTYEYGYRYLNPLLGFSAGWMFLCAKSASAATAALGFAGYLLNATGSESGAWRIAAAVATVAILTLVILRGVRLSAHANTAIVATTLATLGVFVLAGAPLAARHGAENLTPFFPPAGRGAGGVLEACALMFVAYTGYGRVATLGEEVRDPERNIPRAIIVTLGVSMALYAAVGLVAVASVGADKFGDAGTVDAAPLEVVARQFGVPGVGPIVALGAMTAMLGVLLNLILGLSRVLLAMGRRRDMPAVFARLDAAGASAPFAVLAVGLAVGGLALVGSVKTTWSFSAFTVLVYYAITNLAALRLPPESRRYPRLFPAAGLASCLLLAFWVERNVWLAGFALLAAGAVWHFAARRLTGATGGERPA